LPNENRVAHISPRFSGVVREIHKSLGDSVASGEVLARIESNQGLQSYDVRALHSGVVIKRHATVGEFVKEGDELFVVADLSEIWADFQVYRDDVDSIETGEKIRIDMGTGEPLPAMVTYTSPLIDEATQSRQIRAVLANASGRLRPGLFVSAVVASDQGMVPIAVRTEAVQSFRNFNVVFLTDGHEFQAAPVKLGRADGDHVEVLSGIAAGQSYVSRNSFIVKADIEKSGASHDH
jgi:cobalt-zinc-cadmium efflux system membrane fusion protein